VTIRGVREGHSEERVIGAGVWSFGSGDLIVLRAHFSCEGGYTGWCREYTRARSKRRALSRILFAEGSVCFMASLVLGGTRGVFGSDQCSAKTKPVGSRGGGFGLSN